ncbi:DUF2059 domain-containing protein [Hymenobacter sp. BT175]|uniref:DUF2059 domain-containing protein n=1 Tax=Hymenobacter translucens TaxID=2886507 RepID=UPI001D0E632B|nr:DUF2059 domain-containing protein [Hymenobacter translucens]MCC2547171.1 DUF2059 domain-containing protein [Hymenobacter translucens]
MLKSILSAGSRRVLCVALGALLLSTPAVLAQTAPATPASSPTAPAEPLAPGLRKASEELLQVLQMEKFTTESINQMLTMQIQQRPGLEVVEPEMRAFMNKYMSWNALREDMVRLYAREFTEKELRDLVKFYKSPTGQKYVSKQSSLMQSGMEIGQRRVRENMPELQRTVEEKMKSRAPAGQ